MSSAALLRLSRPNGIELQVERSPSAGLVCAFLVDTKLPGYWALVSTTGARPDIRRDEHGHLKFWLGHTSFRINSSEAHEIASTFGLEAPL